MGYDEDVRFEFEVDGLDATWGVRTVTLRETVGAPYSGIVEALADGDHPQTSSLLGKGFVLRLSRAAELRVVRGIPIDAPMRDTLGPRRSHEGH